MSVILPKSAPRMPFRGQASERRFPTVREKVRLGQYRTADGRHLNWHPEWFIFNPLACFRTRLASFLHHSAPIDRSNVSAFLAFLLDPTG